MKINNNSLKSDLKELKEKESYLNLLQQEYNKQTGLSFSNSNIPLQSINLPLHPTTLQKELEDYKDYANNLEEVLIHKETKEKYLRFLIQDPPYEINLNELENAEKKTIDLGSQIKSSQNSINDLNNTIVQKTFHIETLKTQISISVDQLNHMLSKIDEKSKLLSELEKEFGPEKEVLSLEEANHIQEQLTQDIIQININIDEKRDKMIQMKKEASEIQHILDELEGKLEITKKQAYSEKVFTTKERQDIDEAVQWYDTLAIQCSHMMGIDHVEKSSNGIIIHFINKDELNIIIKHDKIENARVTSQDCSIDDLVKIAKSYQKFEDGIHFIIHGTFTRLK
ncbi:hypothetical protein BDC45DRAFT_88591 [Circinella umbellata]|nr:hypothetical protein BDC45DRAFT_88591 [Circinella umbellata]